MAFIKIYQISFYSETFFGQLATGAGESAPPSSLFSRVFRAASSAVSSPLQWTSEFARSSGSRNWRKERSELFAKMFGSDLPGKLFFFGGGWFLMVFYFLETKRYTK